MHLRKTIFDAAQHFLVPVNLQVGMQAALHQYAGAAEFDGLANLFVDGVEIDDVSYGACGMKPAADRVGFHADADQVIGLEHLQRLLLGEGHLQFNSNGGWGLAPNLGSGAVWLTRWAG